MKQGKAKGKEKTMNTNTKKIEFVYDMKTVLKRMKDYMLAPRLPRFKGITADGELFVRVDGSPIVISKRDLCNAFGGEGGYYRDGDYIEPCVKFVKDADGADCLSVAKSLLTYDEFTATMRRHNEGFADKGNPQVLHGVIVYAPSASGWKRCYWDCPFECRAYRTDSRQEPFLEKDPSSGMCRHQHMYIDSLDGREHLLRPEPKWKADYCYIEEA